MLLYICTPQTALGATCSFQTSPASSRAKSVVIVRFRHCELCTPGTRQSTPQIHTWSWRCGSPRWLKVIASFISWCVDFWNFWYAFKVLKQGDTTEMVSPPPHGSRHSRALRLDRNSRFSRELAVLLCAVDSLKRCFGQGISHVGLNETWREDRRNTARLWVGRYSRRDVQE